MDHQRFYPDECSADPTLNTNQTWTPPPPWTSQTWSPQTATNRQSYHTTPSSLQSYPDDESYVHPRESPYQSYPLPSYPNDPRDQEPTLSSCIRPPYVQPDGSYQAPVTYSSYSSSTTSYTNSPSSCYFASNGSGYQPLSSTIW